MATLQGIDHIGKGGDGHTGHLSQAVDVVGKSILIYVHGLVGPPRRQHLDFKTALTGCRVVAQVVYGVVGGAHTLYMVVAHEPSGTEIGLGELLVAGFVDFACVIGTKKLVYAKSGAQFEMCPVVKGITVAVRHSFSPLLKLFPIAGITRDVAFVNTIGAHGSPLVVISS